MAIFIGAANGIIVPTMALCEPVSSTDSSKFLDGQLTQMHKVKSATVSAYREVFAGLVDDITASVSAQAIFRF